MNIEREQRGTKGRFFIKQNEKIVAEMTYTMPADNKMIIEHTEVGEELKGQNAGKQMLADLVNYVRANQIKVIPLCPFANAMFKRTPEYADVLIQS